MTRTQFVEAVQPIREKVKATLEEGANYQVGYSEKTPLAKTVRTCRQLLKVEPAIWLFVTVEGPLPTNNGAERAIRPALLWRRTRKGSQSELRQQGRSLAGSLFVARMRPSGDDPVLPKPQCLGIYDKGYPCCSLRSIGSLFVTGNGC